MANEFITRKGFISLDDSTVSGSLFVSGTIEATQTAVLEGLENAAADTDKFLVATTDGTVKFRTGAEVLSDIGAGSSTLNGEPGEIAFFDASTQITGSLFLTALTGSTKGIDLDGYYYTQKTDGSSGAKLIAVENETSASVVKQNLMNFGIDPGSFTWIGYSGSFGGGSKEVGRFAIDKGFRNHYRLGSGSFAAAKDNAFYVLPETTFFNGVNMEGHLTITGSLTVSGSNTFRNIGPAYFTEGNVGIGTENPSYNLHVSGTSVATLGIIANNEGKSYLRMHTSTNEGVYFEADDGATNHLYIRNATDNAHLLAIDRSSGNVGIGTTTPTQKLEVRGNLILSGSNSRILFDDPQLDFVHDLFLRPTGTGQLDYRFGGGTKVYFNNHSIRFGDWDAGTGTNAASYDPRIQKRGFGQLAGGLDFYTNNQPRVSISGSNGYVGIGTTTPSDKLDVHGIIALNSVAFISQSANVGYIGDIDGADQITNLDINTADGSTRIFLDDSGNVGINTETPSTALHISGGNNFRTLQLEHDNPGIYFKDKGYTQGYHIGYNADELYILRDSDGNGDYNNILASWNSTRYKVWGDQTIGGDLTVDGIVTAQEFHTEFVSASIIYQSGSTKFGDTVDDFHSFTGSLEVLTSTFAGNRSFILSGSAGPRLQRRGDTAGWASEYGFNANDGTNLGGFGAYSGISNGLGRYYIGTYNSDERVSILDNGNVGIGTSSPAARFEVQTIDSNRYVRFKAPNGEERFQFYTGGTGNPAAQHMYNADGTTRNVQIAAGGTSYFNGGNVGIGTTSPNVKLEIKGGTSENTQLRLQTAGGASEIPTLLFRRNSAAYGEIKYNPGGGGDQGIHITDYRKDASNIIFNTSGSVERMRIDTDGNVGIGTTSPTSKLNIVSTTNDPDALTVQDDARKIKIGRDSIQVTTLADSATTMYLNGSGGNVSIPVSSLAIGTTSPTEKLTVQDGTIVSKDSSGTNYAEIDRFSGITMKGNGAGSRGIQTPNTDDLTFGTNGSERMRIQSNGQIGFGVVSPSGSFQFRGGQFNPAYNAFNGVLIDSSQVAHGIDEYGVGIEFTALSKVIKKAAIVPVGSEADNDTTGLAFLVSSGSSQGLDVMEALRLKARGGLKLPAYGQGNFTANSTYRLAVDADGNIVEESLGDGSINGLGASRYMARWADTDSLTTSSMYEDASGNIGIGTTNPAVPLHVDGFARLNGGLQLNQNGAVQVYQIQDNDLRFGTNNTERMRIDNTGNVGIATTSPNEKLEVAGNIRLQNSGRVYLWRDNNSNYIDYAMWLASTGTTQTIQNTGIGGIQLKTLSSTRMYVSASGNVGIGTITPDYKLQVEGSADVVNIAGSGSTANTSIFSVDGNNGRLFEVSDDLSDSLFSVNTIAGLPVLEVFADNRIIAGAYNQNDLVISGSRVGIGTDAPTTKIHIHDANSSDAVYASFTNSTTGLAQQFLVGINQTEEALIWNKNNKSVIFGTNNGERMRILPNGNVGIGISSPSDKLHVVGTVNVGENKVYNGASNNSAGFELIGSRFNIHGYHGITFNSSNAGIGSQTERMRITSSGNVGIGITAPTAKLDVDGTIKGHSINLGSGTVSLPALHFGADTNTGIYRPSGDTLGVSVGGNLRLQVLNDLDEAVKINTVYYPWTLGSYDSSYTSITGLVNGSSFGALINGPNSGQIVLKINNNDNDDSFSIVSNSANGGNVNPDRLVFRTKASGYAYFPGAGARLHVGDASNGGGLRFGDETDRNAIIYGSAQLQIKTTQSQGITFKTTTSSTERMRITSSGNVGIGTASPQQKLVIANSTGGQGLEFVPGTTSTIQSYDRNGGAYAGLNIDIAGLHVRTNATDSAIYVKSSNSFVGLGNAAPTQRLTVEGSISASGDLYLGSTGTGHIRTTGNTNLRLYPAGSGQLYLGDAGNGMRMYHYSDVTAGQYTTYSWSGNYYTLGTSATNGFKFTSEVIMDGNLTVSGIVTAQEFHTEFVSASIIYESGSTKFGDTLDDTHSFTGSLELTGSAVFSLPDANSVPLTLDSPSSGVNVNFGFKIGDTSLGLHPKNLVIRGSSGASDIAFSPSTSYPGMMMLDGSTGNVGIGTTSPQTTLHISGAGHSATVLRVEGVASYNTDYRGDGFSFTGNQDYTIRNGASRVLNLHQNDFQVFTADIERIRVNSSGNVGIGQSTPIEKLHVDGNIHIEAESNALGGGGLYFGISNSRNLAIRQTSTQKDFAIDTYNGTESWANRLTIKNDGGNVGIGTSSPSEKLEVAGTVKATSFIGNAGVPVKLIVDNGALNDSTELRTGGGQFKLYSGRASGAHQKFVFATGDNYTSGATRMTISNSGTVSINGSGQEGWSGNKLNVGSTSDGSNGINILTSTTGNGYIIFSDAADNSATEYANQIRFSHTDNFLSIQTVGSERMRIASNGNVGIGTTAPTAKLDVAGTTVINGTYRGGTLQVNDYNSNIDGARIYGYSNNEILSLISRYDQADGGLFFKRGTNGSETTIGQINFVSNQFRIDASIGSLLIETGGTAAVGINSSQTFQLSQYGSGNKTGTAAYNLQVDSSGNIIETAAAATSAVGGSGVAEEVAVWSSGANVSGSQAFTWNGDVLFIDGVMEAREKSFNIKHPTKENKRLIYGVLEGPEHGVYVRGKIESNVIELPEEWVGLVDEDSITVQLTSIGSHQNLYVSDIKDNKIFIKNGNTFSSKIKAFYYVQGTRKDVKPLVTERDA